MKGLTNRQQEILEFITASLDERGYPPTIREIGTQMGIKSTNGVNDHLKALERKGFLTRDDLKSRAIRPTGYETTGDWVNVPVLGRVAAGEPILAVEHAEDSVKVDRVLLGGHREVFALRIVGESMIEDGIYDGDYVFVKKTSSAKEGEIVIVLVENEATCKRIYREPGRIRLQPANASMGPIYVNASDFRETMVIGKVVGVFRKM
ncbi:MAG: repressor LexA [Myxococcales bacterium]|nr:repressor LexA [Myxococcales bacterium]|tara:strand:+ start:516 stop:1133 length:618 start_codon:yes stop_codon:yes gene_type:complete